MKILYAIQGTGNGHISRARAIIPELAKHGEIDVLISGMQVDVQLEHPVKYQFQGLGFIFGKRGGIDLMATYRKNKLKRFKREINSLPVEEYDLVISDFEPVSAWACLQAGKPCIGLSHQSAVLNPRAPQPRSKDRVGTAFLNYYAPVTRHYGFHFQAYDAGIFTPVIRDGVRCIAPGEDAHYTVYLPAYSDKRILALLLHFPEVQWQVFSRHTKTVIEKQNVFIRPIHDNLFLQHGLLKRGALRRRLRDPAEALFLKKKLMVVPMKGQYEQQCNAAALKKMGVPVLKNLKPENVAVIDSWLDESVIPAVDYPDQTPAIIATLLKDYRATADDPEAAPGMPSGKKFKKSLFQKIVAAYISG